MGNTLDYSAYTNSITVDLTAGTATFIPAGILGFSNVIGGAGDDKITGNSANNILVGNGGIDAITGGAPEPISSSAGPDSIPSSVKTAVIS